MTITKWVRATFSASGVSAKICPYTYGVPAPTAAWGFAQNYARTVGGALNSGVAYIVHNFEPYAKQFGRTAVYSLPRSAERDVVGGTQLDMPRCELRATLLFRVLMPASSSSDFPAEMDRFAGGRISAGSLDFETCHTLSSALAHIPPGFAAQSVPRVGDLTIPALIQEITPQEGKKGWRTPTLLGYRLLEEPRIRRGTRLPDIPHAYADPLVGVITWESIVAHRRADGTALTFWGPKWITPQTLCFEHQDI